MRAFAEIYLSGDNHNNIHFFRVNLFKGESVPYQGHQGREGHLGGARKGGGRVARGLGRVGRLREQARRLQ